MGGIKRTPADAAFSKCIRERANWSCERCNKKHEESSQGLHCSHHHSRGKWGIRFEPINAEALCYGCHSLEGGTEQRRKQVLSDGEQDILWEKMADISLAKESRKTKGKGEIAKHYRDEYSRMKELRTQGESGRIEFVGWI